MLCHQIDYFFTQYSGDLRISHKGWLIPKKENFFLLLDPLPEAAILVVRSLIYFRVAKVDFFLLPVRTIYSSVHSNSTDPTESIFLDLG